MNLSALVSSGTSLQRIQQEERQADRLLEAMGPDTLAARLQATRTKLAAVDAGLHRRTLFVVKPASR